MSNKVCKIDSGNIVNGYNIFYHTTLSQWDSPLSKLQNGSFMFSQVNLKQFNATLNTLKTGTGMFSHSNLTLKTGKNVGWYSTDVSQFSMQLDSLVNGIGMFTHTNFRDKSNYYESMYNGKVSFKIPKNCNMQDMFSYSRSTAIGVVLNESENGSYGMSAVGMFCGAQIKVANIYYANQIANFSNMFKDYQGDVYLQFNYGGDDKSMPQVMPQVYFTSMFQHATVRVKYMNKTLEGESVGGYYDYKGNWIYGTSDGKQQHLGRENFFSDLAVLYNGKLKSTEGMLKKFTYTSFAVYENISSLPSNSTGIGAWYNISSSASMFEESAISSLHVDDFMDLGWPLNADRMFYNCTSLAKGTGIGPGPNARQGNIYIGGSSFYTIISANSMFEGCTSIETVNIAGTAMNGLCGTNTQKSDCRNMFKGCTHLRNFFFGNSEHNNDTTTQYQEYDNASLRLSLGLIGAGDSRKGLQGAGMFSGCIIDNPRSLYNIAYFAVAADAITVGVDKYNVSRSSEMQNILQTNFGVTYPATAGTIRNCQVTIEYNDWPTN